MIKMISEKLPSMIQNKLDFASIFIHVLWPVAAPAARPWPRSLVLLLCRSYVLNKGKVHKVYRIWPFQNCPTSKPSTNIFKNDLLVSQAFSQARTRSAPLRSPQNVRSLTKMCSCVGHMSKKRKKNIRQIGFNLFSELSYRKCILAGWPKFCV